MTQESKSPEPETSSETESKLLIDRPNDFRFHAAYLVYSQVWDKASSNEAKSKLNEIMEALSSGNLEYESFYRRISSYRDTLNPEQYKGGRTYIEAHSKKDWRKTEQRNRRNERHGR